MKNLLFMLLFAAAMFLAIFFYWQFSNGQKEVNLARQRITDRDTRIYKQDKLVDSLQKRLAGDSYISQDEDTIALPTPPSAQFMDEFGSLSETEIKRLQQNGLRNPEVELKNNLIKNPQLIPANSTGGGKMAFRDIRILNDHYALANFEDGHNGGNMLLKFTVVNGNIAWKVLDNYKL